MNIHEYRQRVLGCWLGKNIGGTLGSPFEWMRQTNNVSFYTQDLGGNPLPNDDLDIQLVWLVALEEQGIEIDSRVLADYWCLYVTPHWCEYGTGKINMRSGLLPPLSGSLHNEYKNSCGAFIRSEIWACISPGMPAVAVRYAYEDAILDHGDGEGTFAEVFTAALESAAFVVDDLELLLKIGLSWIPPECGVAQAVKTALSCFHSGKTWQEARDQILCRHRGSSFLMNPDRTSGRDRELGLAEGKRGYDAPSNIGMTVLGLLWGGDDFDRMITTTVNCGEDTDCTAATAGSIYGIIHGARAIPDRWIAPIGRSIKTACVNLGELGYFGSQLPRDIDALMDRIERIARQVLLRDGRDLGDSTSSVAELMSTDAGCSLYALGGPRFEFDFFSVLVDYLGSPLVKDGVPRRVRFTIHNTYKIQANLSFHWYLREGWRVRPSADGYAMSLPTGMGAPLTLDFELECDPITRTMNRAAFEITIEGRPTIMLVPITLLNGNTDSSAP